MLRSIASLLLLPCVLLSQSAALCVHSHGGREPAGHDLRPHFHTNPVSAAHSHGHHHHGSDGHHHHHGSDGHHPHEGGDGPVEPDTRPIPQPDPLSEHDHDSDAVYVACVDVILSGRSSLGEAAVSLLWVASGLCLPGGLCPDRPQEALSWMHAPPPRGYACPLYLWQRALLI
jgi:hypothetical protein